MTIHLITDAPMGIELTGRLKDDPLHAFDITFVLNRLRLALHRYIKHTQTAIRYTCMHAHTYIVSRRRLFFSFWAKRLRSTH